MPNFEVFSKDMLALAKEPTVTLQRRGLLVLNKAAFMLLDRPQAVELLFDPRERIMGLREVSPLLEHAYAVRGGDKPNGPYVLSGAAFARYYGIPTEVARRWTARMQSGVLCVDLKEPGIDVTTSREAGPSEPSTHRLRGGGPV